MSDILIKCKGLYAKKEMDWDQGTNSDEYYLITTVWATQDDGTVRTQTVRVPGVKSTYSDVDSGETRKADLAMYVGPAKVVMIGTQLLEHDWGNAETTRKKFEEWANTAADASEATGHPVPDEVKKALPIIREVFGLRDDKVGAYQTLTKTRAELRTLMAEPAKEAHGIEYRLSTEHKGGGAKVFIYYDVLPA